MLLERTTVSRKTPRDGKLEITEATAAKLARVGTAIAISTPEGSDTVLLETMACTCSKREGERHVHHFLTSPLLERLVAESQVRIDLDERSGTLVIQPDALPPE